MNRSALLVVCLVLAALLGCGSEPASEPASGSARADPASEHMRDHFEQVRGVQVGVIRGDLDTVRAAAKWVATHEGLSGMPADWEPYVLQMRGAAEDALAAEDLQVAARATATMGRSCAACHEAMQQLPQFLDVAQPPESTETVPHMIGHKWAADRMWRGLVTPSSVDWNNGVAALSADPLAAEVLASETEEQQQLGALAVRVHDLAAQGRAVTDLDARAEIYGRFLATCAECHQLLGIASEQ